MTSNAFALNFWTFLQKFLRFRLFSAALNVAILCLFNLSLKHKNVVTNQPSETLAFYIQQLQHHLLSTPLYAEVVVESNCSATQPTS